jgi:hypothetical protein
MGGISAGRAYRPMQSILIFLLVLFSGVATAQGITFSGGGRDYPYPNEPQYQYPSTDARGRIWIS